MSIARNKNCKLRLKSNSKREGKEKRGISLKHGRSKSNLKYLKLSRNGSVVDAFVGQAYNQCKEQAQDWRSLRDLIAANIPVLSYFLFASYFALLSQLW